MTVRRFFKNYLSKWFFRLRHITPRHRCQLPIIRFVPKYLDQTLVIFSASPAEDWQTGCLWWEVVESRFHVDLKSNFALKNNSMELLLGPITLRINVLYESRMKWTWRRSKLAAEEVSFFRGLRVVLLQLLSIHDRAVSVANRLVLQMRATLTASREPAGKLWQLCKVLYVFEQKRQYFLIHAQCGHLSNTPHPYIVNLYRWSQCTLPITSIPKPLKLSN